MDGRFLESLSLNGLEHPGSEVTRRLPWSSQLPWFVASDQESPELVDKTLVTKAAALESNRQDVDICQIILGQLLFFGSDLLSAYSSNDVDCSRNLGISVRHARLSSLFRSLMTPKSCRKPATPIISSVTRKAQPPTSKAAVLSV
jgi:hypothetical protein